MSKKPIDTYKQVNTSHDVSPYRTVQLLLEGALQRVMLAKHAQVEGDAEIRGMAVGSTITILGVLQASFGVLQGSCRVSRVFKLLFSVLAAPSLG
jgi:flagellar protein FliS